MLVKLVPGIVCEYKSQGLLERLNEEQIKMILEYIDPHVWQIRIKRKEADFEWVKELSQGRFGMSKFLFDVDGTLTPQVYNGSWLCWLVY